jgi:hypothetical protein
MGLMVKARRDIVLTAGRCTGARMTAACHPAAPAAHARSTHMVFARMLVEERD